MKPGSIETNVTSKNVTTIDTWLNWILGQPNQTRLLFIISLTCVLIFILLALIWATTKKRRTQTNLTDLERLNSHLFLNQKVSALQLSAPNISTLSNPKLVPDHGHPIDSDINHVSSKLYETDLGHISSNGIFIIAPCRSSSSSSAFSGGSSETHTGANDHTNSTCVLFRMNTEQQTNFLSYYGQEKNPILMAKAAYRRNLMKRKKKKAKKKRLNSPTVSVTTSNSSSLSLGSQQTQVSFTRRREKKSSTNLDELKRSIRDYLRNPELNGFRVKYDCSGGLGRNECVKLRHLVFKIEDVEETSKINFYLYDVNQAIDNEKIVLDPNRFSVKK
jgi:hypothetical protein